QCALVRSRCPAKPQVDSARVELFQRAELLSDDIGSMVGQHDTAGTNPNGVAAFRDMAYHNRRRCAADPRTVVMVDHPDTVVSPALGMGGEITRIIERLTGTPLLGNTNKFKNGERQGHDVLPGQESACAAKTAATHATTVTAMHPGCCLR